MIPVNLIKIYFCKILICSIPHNTMEIGKYVPIMVFDNQCYVCVKFARLVDFFARGRITMVGHYTDFGVRIRDEILDESALDMFWFIDNNLACGGRAALLPLIRSILSKRMKRSSGGIVDSQQGCKTLKAVFLRSSSLLTNSRRIDI